MTQQTTQQTEELEAQLALANRVKDEKARELTDLLGGTPDRFDGAVLATDPVNRLVYLNVGRADGIRPRITFGIL